MLQCDRACPRHSAESGLCQAKDMARGWESKAVESQIESANERISQARVAQVSSERLQLERERESIELSRTRVRQDIANATHIRYREILHRSLEHLDRKIALIDDSLNKLDHRE
jgi:chromosome segregation ATPase